MPQCSLTSSALTSLHTNHKSLSTSSSCCSSAVNSNRSISRIRCAAEGDEPEDDFEARLAKLQRKVTSGTGKKAELRKARKEGADPYAKSSSSSKQSSIILPPVMLEEPMSDGLPVELGFNSYTERLNGRFAALGLAAVLLVELATGGALIKFHDSSTLFTQVYVVLGAAALLVKLEKEKISVWPKT